MQYWELPPTFTHVAFQVDGNNGVEANQIKCHTHSSEMLGNGFHSNRSRSIADHNEEFFLYWLSTCPANCQWFNQWFILECLAVWIGTDFFRILKWVWKMMIAIAKHNYTTNGENSATFSSKFWRLPIISLSQLYFEFLSFYSWNWHVRFEYLQLLSTHTIHNRSEWQRNHQPYNRSQLLRVHCFYLTGCLGNLANKQKVCWASINFAISYVCYARTSSANPWSRIECVFNHFRANQRQRNEIVVRVKMMCAVVATDLIYNKLSVISSLDILVVAHTQKNTKVQPFFLQPQPTIANDHNGSFLVERGRQEF